LFELPLMGERYTRAAKLKMRLWSQVQCSRTVGNGCKTEFFAAA